MTEVVTYEPEAVRIATAARLLDIGLTMAYQLVREGKLKTITIGSDKRVTMASIKAMVAGETV